MTQTKQTTGQKPLRRFRYSGFLQGSIKSDRSDVRYHVGADIETGQTFCTCPAGQMGRQCKHQVRLLQRSLGRLKRGVLAGVEA